MPSPYNAALTILLCCHLSFQPTTSVTCTRHLLSLPVVPAIHPDFTDYSSRFPGRSSWDYWLKRYVSVVWNSKQHMWNAFFWCWIWPIGQGLAWFTHWFKAVLVTRQRWASSNLCSGFQWSVLSNVKQYFSLTVFLLSSMMGATPFQCRVAL